MELPMFSSFEELFDKYRSGELEDMECYNVARANPNHKNEIQFWVPKSEVPKLVKWDDEVTARYNRAFEIAVWGETKTPQKKGGWFRLFLRRVFGQKSF